MDKKLRASFGLISIQANCNVKYNFIVIFMVKVQTFFEIYLGQFLKKVSKKMLKHRTY